MTQKKARVLVRADKVIINIVANAHMKQQSKMIINVAKRDSETYLG